VHLWRRLVLMHELHRPVWPLRRLAHSWRLPRFRGFRGFHIAQKKPCAAARVDVLVLDPDSTRLSKLASKLTTLGMQVMSTITSHEARAEAARLNPRVIVASSPLGVAGAGDLLDDIHGRRSSTARPVMIAFSVDDARLDWADWDRWFPRSADPSDIAQAVTEALGPR
jgi:hypothetical protein